MEEDRLAERWLSIHDPHVTYPGNVGSWPQTYIGASTITYLTAHLSYQLQPLFVTSAVRNDQS